MVGAEHRADALGGKFEHLHVCRPWRFGVPQRRIQPRLAWVQLALAGRQLQAQLGQVAIEPIQPRDEPARQQAAGATEHERRLAGLPLQLDAGTAQALEGLAGGVTQTHARIGEFYAAPFLDEQGQTEGFVELLQLPADGPVGDVQLACGFAYATQAGSRLEGTQGIERWQIAGHICEFS